MEHFSKLFLCAAGTLMVLGLAGCGGGGGSGPINMPVTPVVPLPHSVSAVLPNGLTATVAEDQTSIPVGGTVTYTMTLTNTTAQPITFQPIQRDTRPSGGVGDSLTIVNPTGGEGGLLTFPLGAFAQVITVGPSSTLAPGKSVSGTVLVGPNGPGGFPTTGDYVARVSFNIQTGQGAAGTNTTVAQATVGPLEVDAR